jgi:hypothetical protein
MYRRGVDFSAIYGRIQHFGYDQLAVADKSVLQGGTQFWAMRYLRHHCAHRAGMPECLLTYRGPDV